MEQGSGAGCAGVAAGTGWGKDKLAVILNDNGWPCSASMVGRILHRLHDRGDLVEAPGRDPWMPRWAFQRPYGVRKPKDYLPNAPGDIVQIDTAQVTIDEGLTFKHFRTCDIFSRWQILEAHSGATAHAAAGFLDTVLARMPFPVRAVQVDGGSELMAQFEDACQKRGIRLFVLPPRSPKLNGHVERSQRTHREEFYRRVHLPASLELINREFRRWENVHNCHRPHQALHYRTPRAFLDELAVWKREQVYDTYRTSTLCCNRRYPGNIGTAIERHLDDPGKYWLTVTSSARAGIFIKEPRPMAVNFHSWPRAASGGVERPEHLGPRQFSPTCYTQFESR